VYDLAFLTSAAHENPAVFGTELLHAQGTVAGLVSNFKHSVSPEKPWITPVALLLSAMLPEKVDL
jgi:hypothetical protein